MQFARHRAKLEIMEFQTLIGADSLQELLGVPTPRYRHHELLTDAHGRRLAKRDRATTIRAMRAAGMTPAELLDRALAPGI